MVLIKTTYPQNVKKQILLPILFSSILRTCQSELINPKRKKEKELMASANGCRPLVEGKLLNEGESKNASD